MGPDQSPRVDNGDPGNRPDLDAQLLLVHLAEFGAITMRNTYWLTLQYALLPILGAGIAVLAQMWNAFGKDLAISTQAHRIIIWFAIVIINVVVIAHTKVGWESYNNVVYLENRLRPRVMELVSAAEDGKRTAALGYETYLREQRGARPKWWEVPGPIVSCALLLGGIAVFGGLFYRLFGLCYGWTRVELLAIPINTLLTLMVVKVTIKMVRRRQDIGKLE